MAVKTSERQRQEQRRTRPAYELVRGLTEQLHREIARRWGASSTFEQRRDAARGAFIDSMWLEEDRDLRALVVDAPELAVDGRRYGRLEHPSSATYSGWSGPHSIEEELCREVGARNAPTVKPVKLRAGIIEHITPSCELYPPRAKASLYLGVLEAQGLTPFPGGL